MRVSVCLSGRGRGDVRGVQEAAEDAAGPSGSGVSRAAAGGRATSLHQHHAVRASFSSFRRKDTLNVYLETIR